MRANIVIILFFVLLISACGSKHSFSETEFATRQVKVGDMTFGYRVYLPANRQSGQKLPVMLYLHGSNRRGDDNQAQLLDLADIIKANPQNFPYIIVVPQCRPDTFWAGPMMAQALAALDQTVKEFEGDESKLFIAGYSMGGFGVWQTAITHPGKFAALVSVAGGVESRGRVSDQDKALLSPQVTAAANARDPYKAYAEALAKMPVWVVHGNKDEAVPVDASRKIVAALKAADDTDVNYIELDGVGHGSVGTAFADERLSKWLVKQQIERPYDLGLSQQVGTADGAFHRLEIKRAGVYWDYSPVSTKTFDDVWPIADTMDYWALPDSYFTNASTGHYFLFGTHVMFGVCGMSNYAVVHVSSEGKVRISDESPNACMGDNPSEIRFSVDYRDGNCHPTWRLSNALEFDAFTFQWRDLSGSSKPKTAKK